MTLVRSALITIACAATLTACGSDDDATATADGGTESAVSAVPSDETEATSTPAEGGDGGSGASTITVDGTTYELDVGECEGSNTDSSGYPFPDNFSLSGTAIGADLEFSIARNGPADELYVQVGSLEGDRDENGQNEKLLYRADMPTLDFRVSGPDVSGSVDVLAIGPTRPYGEATLVEFAFDC